MLHRNNQYTYLKKELMVRYLKVIMENKEPEEVNRIPFKIIPSDAESKRCCIYKDREMIRYRIAALSGFDLETEYDESRPPEYYLRKAQQQEPDGFPLTVIKAACSSCPQSSHQVTELCRGCLARPCQNQCPKDAISMQNGKAIIDQDKCVNCGKCKMVCPYSAIAYNPAPCEASCPVGAIDPEAGGGVELNKEKCISCGRCTRGCPFGAIVERSQLLPLTTRLKSKVHMTALVAPSIEGQLPGNKQQIFSAIKAAGFSAVYDMAEAADQTAEAEAEELAGKLKKGQSFMTTSCCPSYMEAVNKHFPEIKPFVSHTPSPMIFASRNAKKETPGTITVFIGPCIAKKQEVRQTGEVPYVIGFEELGALLMALEIEISDQNDTDNDVRDFEKGAGFRKSGGVFSAVESKSEIAVKGKIINGLDKKSLTLLKIHATQKPPIEDIIEVMACEGGCQNGPCTLV